MPNATISDDDNDIRLDRWFKRHQPGMPHALLEKHLRKGLIRLDGKKAKTSDRVTAGQELSFPEVKLEAVKAKPRASEDDMAEIRKWVLYKDDNLIVINKPYGLAVQGGSKVTRSVDGMLDGLAFDARERPKLTHRLDRDTSGVLVLARSAKAATALMKLFSAGKGDKGLEKIYWALVNGSPLPPKGMVDLPLNKLMNASDREQMAVDEDDGKYACTEYRVLDSLARKFALMELKPLTGRMHQLRVHMAAIGCPIVGDHKYGGSTEAGEGVGVENILHLHARRIIIPPILGGKRVDVSAPLPKHMVASFKALGLDVPKK